MERTSVVAQLSVALVPLFLFPPHSRVVVQNERIYSFQVLLRIWLLNAIQHHTNSLRISAKFTFYKTSQKTYVSIKIYIQVEKDLLVVLTSLTFFSILFTNYSYTNNFFPWLYSSRELCLLYFLMLNILFDLICTAYIIKILDLLQMGIVSRKNTANT